MRHLEVDLPASVVLAEGFAHHLGEGLQGQGPEAPRQASTRCCPCAASRRCPGPSRVRVRALPPLSPEQPDHEHAEQAQDGQDGGEDHPEPASLVADDDAPLRSHVEVQQRCGPAQRVDQHADGVQDGRRRAQPQGEAGPRLVAGDPPADGAKQAAEIEGQLNEEQAGYPGQEDAQVALGDHQGGAEEQDAGARAQEGAVEALPGSSVLRPGRRSRARPSIQFGESGTMSPKAPLGTLQNRLSANSGPSEIGQCTVPGQITYLHFSICWLDIFHVPSCLPQLRRHEFLFRLQRLVHQDSFHVSSRGIL